MERRLSFLAVGLLAASSALPAQTTHFLSVHIPFAFVAVDKSLPAGDYTVNVSADGTVLIRSKDNLHALLALTQAIHSVGVKMDAKLVFYRFGEPYFLSEIWHGGTEGGERIPVPPGQHLSAASWPKTRLEILASIPASRKQAK
jgi:hypothetical protein